MSDPYAIGPDPAPQPAPAPAPAPLAPVPPPPRPGFWTFERALLSVVAAGLLAFQAAPYVAPHLAPKPAAPVVPAPAPSGPAAVDPAIRQAAAGYFRGYPDRYDGDRSAIAATAATYNDLMAAQVAARNALGTALGKAIDARTAALYDDKTAFKDRAAAQAVYASIAASLRAGLKDAAGVK